MEHIYPNSFAPYATLQLHTAPHLSHQSLHPFHQRAIRMSIRPLHPMPRHLRQLHPRHGRHHRSQLETTLHFSTCRRPILHLLWPQAQHIKTTTKKERIKKKLVIET